MTKATDADEYGEKSVVINSVIGKIQNSTDVHPDAETMLNLQTNDKKIDGKKGDDAIQQVFLTDMEENFSQTGGKPDNRSTKTKNINKENKIRLSVDILMSVVFLCLLSFPATGREIHSFFGISMGILSILHCYLNRKWYFSLFKGKYTLFRAVNTAIDLRCVAVILLLIMGGFIMNGYLPVSAAMNFARLSHLWACYTAMIIFGLHIGMHIKIKRRNAKSVFPRLIKLISAVTAVYGIYRFIDLNIADYILLKNQFAFFDYSRPTAAVFAENLAMTVLFACMGMIIKSFVTPKKKES